MVANEISIRGLIQDLPNIICNYMADRVFSGQSQNGTITLPSGGTWHVIGTGGGVAGGFASSGGLYIGGEMDDDDDTYVGVVGGLYAGGTVFDFGAIGGVSNYVHSVFAIRIDCDGLSIDPADPVDPNPSSISTNSNCTNKTTFVNQQSNYNAASYFDGGPATYAVIEGHQSTAINSTTGVLSVDIDTAGTYPTSVSATNSSGSAICSFDVVALDTRPRPNGNCEISTLGNENQNEIIDFSQRFLGNTPTSYSIQSSEPNITIDSLTGIVSYNLPSGSYAITVTATNQFGTGDCSTTIVIN